MPGRRRTFWPALALVFLLVPAAHAITIQEVTSPGGITAWLVEDHSIPVVTLALSFRGGAALDPADKAGLSTLTTDLLDEGAGPYDGSAFHDRLKNLAANLDFGAGRDSTGASLRCLTANLAPTAELLRLALVAPRFDAAPVALVRSQLIAAVTESVQQPRVIAERIWRRGEFGTHSYARSIRGTPETVARVTIDDMRDLVRERFAKDVLLVAAVGDITAEALKPLLDRTLGDLPAHAAHGQVPEAAGKTDGGLTLTRLAIPQSVVVFGQPGIKRADPDWYAALLVNHILGGGGFSSRLMEELREKRGLAYSVYSSLQPMEHGAVIAGGVATENSRVAESIDLIRTEWRRMHDQGPTAKELADAKTYLKGSFPLSLDSTSRIATVLVGIQYDRLGIDYLAQRNAFIDAVSLDDAKRVARQLLDPDELFFVVVGSPDNLVGAREVGWSGG